MINAIKIGIMLAVIILMVYPLVPFGGKAKKFFPASGLRYDHPDNRKNLPFLLLVFVEFIACAILFTLLDKAVGYVKNIPFVGNLFTAILKSFNSQIDFIFFTLSLVIVNLIILYVFVFAKLLLKKGFCDVIFGVYRKKRLEKKKERERKRRERRERRKNKKRSKDKNKDQNTVEDNKSDETEDEMRDKKNLRVPGFFHSGIEDDEDNTDEKKDDGTSDRTEGDEEESKAPRYGKAESFILGLFFEGEEFDIARPWVIRTRMIIGWFTVLIGVLYLLFTLVVLASALFPLPKSVYTFLLDFMKLGKWYIYPTFSILFLQELCNIFRTPAARKNNADEEKKKEEEEEKRKLELRLRKLLGALNTKFDAEHHLRYYPEAPKTDQKEYISVDPTFGSAMQYIRDHMMETTGDVVESYMKCLDASFGDDHVYFASSFYSELGSYLVAYTYIRLLSGSRVIYVVTDSEEQATLKTFLSEKLIALTGTSPMNSWRIHTADERLDQADVLIACPKDFCYGNITAQYPDFFEEASNAIFLDADKMILADSYLCPLMATRLMRASEDRIRFIFLTEDLYKGIAARTLPKFFCADPILTFSSAKENESVSYVLWNRESKNHRIYNESGQKTTCLEYLIADQAYRYDVDGIRVLTESSLDHAERGQLENNGVEINRLFRDIVDVNYMIYSDERCNLAASIYACTRFRGQRKSVVHIISKPYLLREYFISKAATENFVNRSSFIQPRVPEHVDEHKLSLFRLYCSLSSTDGVAVSEFERRIRDIITVCRECHNVVASAFCRKMLKEKSIDDLSTVELAAYLVAGLCDTDIGDNIDEEEAASRSVGHRAKEFFLMFDPSVTIDRNFTSKEKYIVFNREREIFERLFACNEHVKLCLNDEIIGELDTFPLRAHLEYVAGQSILYRNQEYEIEHVAEDGKTIYLRSENVKLSHCLDTVHLRRYFLESLEPVPGRVGVLNNTKLNLEEIRVVECKASFVGETYGFYGLSSDKQTVDFYHIDGVDGNPHLSRPNRRNIKDGRIIKLELLSRVECNDRMRMLLAAVFNEFIRTVFPKTYHAISIVPMLEEPLGFSAENEPKEELDRIRALYPYLAAPGEEFIETDKNHITLLLINDCHEDIGAFQWFYDLSGRYMQEFLANIYSYLYWLKLRPNKAHYIYFGGTELPACYDLEGCCTLLEGYNRLLFDIDDEDIETASDDLSDELNDRCAFCHKPVETGRYSLFDKNRYICAECFEVVDETEKLEELHEEMRGYLAEKYPDIVLGTSTAALDPVYELEAGQVLSEYYYRTDLSERTIFVERDDPLTNARVSLLRGLIELWQSDKQLINEYSAAQLYYEELLYLASIGANESAAWIYENLGSAVRTGVDEIAEYTGIAPVVIISEAAAENAAEDAVEETTDDTAEDETKDEKTLTPTGKTSFDFMAEHRRSDDDDFDDDNFFGDDDFGGLYNPNKMPRFLKRYLLSMTVDDHKEEDITEAEEGEDTTDPTPDELEGENKTETGEGEGENKTEPTPPEPSKKDKKKKRFSLFGKKKSAGERIAPVEDEEATNPRLRLYNEIVRHAYDYSEDGIDRRGISDEEVQRVFVFVRGDYPELFWIDTYAYTPDMMFLRFRCKDANDNLDIKQIERKRKEIRNAAKKFTSGISRRTDPYEALLKIYRRLILNTDYDTVGLNARLDADLSKDDVLRSLHSALVEHKVVCAGYAVAMQYLMQSIGIVSAYIISEIDSTNTCHAFNILKLGKYCYYLDATWGDPSNTETGDENRDRIDYNYFCVPYEEFVQAHPTVLPMHQPRKAFYPTLETFGYRNHEFYRYRDAYLPSYNEEEIVRIIADAARDYKAKEMGEFRIGIRTPTTTDAEIVVSKLLSNGNLSRLIERAKASLKKKDDIALLDGNLSISRSYTGVFTINFK